MLAGRTADLPLGSAGRRQAERLARCLAREEIASIYASPRRRAQETAAPIAEASDTAGVITTDALDEVDFGIWSGRSFEELDADPLWRQWNCIRSLVRAPGGETMLDVQRRVAGLVEAQVQENRGRKIVLVSHAEIIRAFICHVLGLSTDAWPRFEIAPASVSHVTVGDWGAKILTLNSEPFSTVNDDTADLSAARR